MEARIADEADNEYRRLLYVGMTRAEDRLILCGYHGRRPPKPTTWHAIACRALMDEPETEAISHPVLPGPVHRFRVTKFRGMDQPAIVEDDTPMLATTPFPQILRQPLPPSRAFPRPLAPSGASSLLLEAGDAIIDGRSPVLEAVEEPGLGIVRGLVLHKLLQMLPALPEADRRSAAARYLERAGAAWPEAERRRAGDSVFAILDDPSFGPLFADGSRAEVAVVGRLDIGGETRLVSGKVDRLAITESSVLIVDYKTNRPPPSDLSSVPEAYLAQLALYSRLISPLYPGKTVSAALLFTEAPRLIAVPGSVMEASLVRLGKA